MKKGFTLIELLAVIVILAVIALIATPLILNVIEKSQKGAVKSSSYAMIEAGELYQVVNDIESIETGLFYDLTDGTVPFKGDKPESGTLILYPKGQSAIKVIMGKWCAVKNKEEVEVKIMKKESPECKLEGDTPATDASHFTFDALTGTITGYSADGPKEVVIPGKIAGVAVKEIGPNAFWGIQITNVTLPKGIVTIGKGAFALCQLSQVIIPTGVTTIEEGAFEGNKITKLILPDSVTSIGKTAFADNLLSDIELPNHLETLGIGAFRKNKLTSLTIPEKITVIEKDSFAENLLTSVTIPGHIKKIGVSAFTSNKLTSVTLHEGIGIIEQNAFFSNQIVSVTIPSSATSLGRNSFGVNLLTSVKIVGKKVASDFDYYGEVNGEYLWGWDPSYGKGKIIWDYKE